MRDLIVQNKAGGGGLTGQQFYALSKIVGVRKTTGTPGVPATPGTGIFEDLDQLVAANFAFYDATELIKEAIDLIKDRLIALEGA